MEKSVKKVYLEYMRILACILVIFNHIHGYKLYSVSSGIRQVFYMFLTMFTRVNVPLFFMVSGVLLLGKQESWKQLFRKRIVRIGGALLVAIGLFYAYSFVTSLLHRTAYPYSVWDMLYALFTMDGEGPFTPFWYLYAYLGFLIILPFLRRTVVNMQRIDMVILVICHFVYSSFLPIFNVILEAAGLKQLYITGNLSIPFANVAAIFYPVLGYYIENNIDIHKIKNKHICGMIIASLVCIAISGVCTCYEFYNTGEYTQNYVQLFDYVLAAITYILIKYAVTVRWTECLQVKLAPIACMIGSLTFGIYLFDPYLRLLGYAKLQGILDAYLPVLLVSVCWIVISMFVGGLLTYLLKRVPVVGKIF